MILPILIALLASGLLFVADFGVLVVIQPPPPIGTLAILTSSAMAASLVVCLYRRHWLQTGLAAGAVSAAYFLLVFATLVQREQIDFWPLAEAVFAVATALLAAKLSAMIRGGSPG